MYLTLQDRLVKELRFEGIGNVEDGNAFLPDYMDVINGEIAKEALNSTDMHCPLTDRGNLEDALCWQRQCTVTKNLITQYDRVMYLLESGELTDHLKHRTFHCRNPLTVNFMELDCK